MRTSSFSDLHTGSTGEASKGIDRFSKTCPQKLSWDGVHIYVYTYTYMYIRRRKGSCSVFPSRLRRLGFTNDRPAREVVCFSTETGELDDAHIRQSREDKTSCDMRILLGTSAVVANVEL